MNIKLLIEHHLEFLSLKVGCTGSPESTFVKIPHNDIVGNSLVAAQLKFEIVTFLPIKSCNEQASILYYIKLDLKFLWSEKG